MKRYRYVLLAFMVGLDQWIKCIIRRNFEVGESRPFLGNFLSLTFVKNKGAAFSLLSGKGLILVIVPIVIAILAIIYMELRKDDHWTLCVAMPLIVSGGLSNVYDRLVFKYVTDMFDLHWWPVFNVADIAICVGCVFLIIYVLAFMGKSKKKEEQNWSYR